MLVETYEVTELDSENNPECEAEAVALIEQLGLTGQQKLLTRSNGETVRAPYRRMTLDEAFVYGKVLPQKTKLDAYSDAPIPVRVLQVAAHAKELYESLYVWHPQNADEKDPLLVGINGPYYSPRETFILARWGEELLSFAELAKKAGKILRAEIKAACGKGITELRAVSESLEELTDEELALMNKSVPSVYNS